MKLWRIAQNDYIVEGFLSEKDADEYIKKEKGYWIKEEYDAYKLDGSKQEFLDYFNLKQNITDEALRECLESIICISPDKDYTISYYCEQWWACGLNKDVNIDGKYYLEEVARGEGDSPLDALCSLFILKHDIIDSKNIERLKNKIEENQ